MISTALGAWSTANALSGGRLNKFVTKNVGKFVGKVGKWGLDKFASENVKNKVNSWAEKGADYLEKTLGSDSEVAKNAKNLSKVLKGEHVETRSWDDGESKPNGVVDIQNTIGNDYAPYSKNLGGTNYQRYYSPVRFMRSKRYAKPVNRVDLKRAIKFRSKK